MKPFKIIAAAKQELSDIAFYYNEQEPGLGGDFHDAVNEAINTIRMHPLIWCKVRTDIRRYVLRRFPFCIIYFYDGDCITILSCKHHKRDGRYWQDRIP